MEDFVFKKGCTYGNLLVDATTHLPIELLMGQDGRALRDWLKQHPQIKAVTRDREKAYAKILSEELPDVIQIADLFYLHQNLLIAVKKALNHSIPASIKILHDPPCSSVESG